MTFLKNLALFFLAYLPAVAIVSMLVGMIPAVRAQTPETWDVGPNPLLWLILTAPWQLPSVVLVPVLHLLARQVADRSSRIWARRVALVAAPTLFLSAVLALWGPSNMNVEMIVPVGLSALLYGAILRIDGREE